MANSTDSQRPKAFKCVARRHMDAEFRVYDAMMAIVMHAANELKETGKWNDGDPLPTCYAESATLANMVDRSKVQVAAQLEKLEESGWIVDLHPEGRQRRRKGDFTSTEYRVLTHAEYVPAYPDACPALRYNPTDGKLIQQGKAAPALRRLNVHRILKRKGLDATLYDFMADEIADAIENKKAMTVNPVQAAKTGNPVLDNPPPSQEILSRANTGNPVTPGTGNPVATKTGNPVTSLKVQSESSKPDTNLQPASLPGKEPDAKKNGGQAGSGRVGTSSSSTKSKSEQLWQEFINHECLPNEMRCAAPTAEEKQKVLTQLEEVGPENLAVVIDDWKEYQSPPLYTLNYGRWKRWLETGGAFFEEAKGYADNERVTHG